MHMEYAVPEKTKHGEIFGRDALFLDEVLLPDEQSLILRGNINTYGGEDERYEIKFADVVHLSMTTFDLVDPYGHGGSFCRIENSATVERLKALDFESFLSERYAHFYLATYDMVFQVVATGYDLKFSPLHERRARKRSGQPPASE